MSGASRKWRQWELDRRSELRPTFGKFVAKKMARVEREQREELAALIGEEAADAIRSEVNFENGRLRFTLCTDAVPEALYPRFEAWLRGPEATLH